MKNTDIKEAPHVMQQPLITQGSELRTVHPQTQIFEIMTKALADNVDVDKLEKLITLQNDWEKKEARKRFFQSFSSFQHDCPSALSVIITSFPSLHK